MRAPNLVGLAPAELKGLGPKLGLTRIGDYFADDANVVSVPAYSVVNATISLNRVVSVASGVGIRGFIRANNLTNQWYVGSVFLSPDHVGGVPVVFRTGTTIQRSGVLLSGARAVGAGRFRRRIGAGDARVSLRHEAVHSGRQACRNHRIGRRFRFSQTGWIPGSPFGGRE